MATSALATFRGSLISIIDTQLSTDSVTGVSTFEFPPGDDHPDTDAVYVGRITSLQEPITFGGASGTRAEELEAQVFIWVRTPGKGDTVAATSEDRALTILGSVETAVRNDPTVSTAVFNAEFAGFDSEPGVMPEGRYTLLTVTITAEAHI